MIHCTVLWDETWVTGNWGWVGQSNLTLLPESLSGLSAPTIYTYIVWSMDEVYNKDDNSAKLKYHGLL